MDNVLIFGRFFKLIFNMFVKTKRISKPSALEIFPLRRALTFLMIVWMLIFTVSCRNHRERLLANFAGHDFEQLDLVNKLEGYDEYSDAAYFASMYHIASSDATVMAKTLDRSADAAFFAKSEMRPLLKSGTRYQYKLDTDNGETTALLLDPYAQVIIFYHSRAGH